MSGLESGGVTGGGVGGSYFFFFFFFFYILIVKRGFRIIAREIEFKMTIMSPINV